jgi:ABC-type branched-subunit amino acid transport system ATPase component
MLADDVLADAVSGPGEHKPSWAVIARRLTRSVDTHGPRRLLVLDEPSMGLSPILVGSILKVLLSLRHRGLSILLVEQNATLTFEATQRCLVMENGHAVPSGTAAELRHNSDVRRIYLGI